MNSAFEITDRYVDDLCALHPTLASFLGVPGRHDEWGDFGLDGLAETHRLELVCRDELAPLLDDAELRERIAARVTVGLIDEHIDGYEAGDHFRDLRHMASRFQTFRSVFDVMPKTCDGDWVNIIGRLQTIDHPLDQYRQVLDEGRSRGIVVALRQVESVIGQARSLAGDNSAYLQLLGEAGGHRSDRLEAVIDHARAAMDGFGDWLASSYAPGAAAVDAVGEAVYRRAANRLVGMEVDTDEAYEWGWEEFWRLESKMTEVGESIVPGADFAAVKDHLETDPAGVVTSTDDLLSFVDAVLTEAVDDLAGSHFEVPDPIRPLTVQISPPGGPLGVSYMRPSEDLTRPGGVWYSVGDQTVFPLYQHRSTAYHEGFPGHHLQLAAQIYRREDLSRAQRLLTWYPGHGEGWAMYAEVLMGELGYLEDPKSYFGMLAKQMYRAARVVVDIGLHLEYRIPESSPIDPGGTWTFDKAVEFMETYGFRTPAQAEGEVLRYLGWPGQAIAYKLGEREILSIREDARRRLGSDFDLFEFHRVFLNSGTMRLDLLRPVVLDQM